jgi:GGDEF domain-containing protein
VIVAFLLAFLLGALAAAAVLAYRAHRRAARLEDELDVVRAELEMAERRDHETGLWNSRHFVEALTREVERSRTYARPVALALASVDGLLEEGDDTEVAMAEIGNAIGSSVRAVAAERLLRAIARVRSPAGRQPLAAVGIAACPAHAETFDGLVERAGSALRSARRAVRRDPPKAGTVTVSMAVWDDADDGE